MVLTEFSDSINTILRPLVVDAIIGINSLLAPIRYLILSSKKQHKGLIHNMNKLSIIAFDVTGIHLVYLVSVELW